MRLDHTAHRLASGVTTTWSDLVGADWATYCRVLHPAYRSDGDVRVRWADLFAAPGQGLATASWFDVSGVRLHSGRTTGAWDVEPSAGPDDDVVKLTLRAVDSAPDEHVWVGEWDGYGWDRDARRDVARLASGSREYIVERTTMAALLREFVPGKPRGFGQWPTPNLLWNESDTWFMNADVDLPSTIVGCDLETGRRLLADPHLEVVEVLPTGRIVA